MKRMSFMYCVMAVVIVLVSCGNGKKQAVKNEVDSCSVVTETAVQSDPFVGKTYDGSGNGGGLYTEMSITFLEDGKCKGTSDWYQAYSEKKTINGTYRVAGDKLIATFMVDDVEIKLEFDVSDNGRVLSFDHSDPEMGGTMGIDIMSLKLNENSSSTAAAKQDSIEANTHSPEVIQNRVKEMFRKDEFFSKDYKSTSKKLQDAGDKYFPGEIVGPDYVVWDTSQGGCGEGNTKFGEVENVTEKTAVIKVFNKFECDENHDVLLHLVFENGDWFVDDISNSFTKSLKNDMKKELKDIVNPSN